MKCKQCDFEFSVPQPVSALQRIFFRRERLVTLEMDLTAQCPNCGYKQAISDRKFFGVLGPRTVRAIVYALVIGSLVVVAWGLLHQLR